MIQKSQNGFQAGDNFIKKKTFPENSQENNSSILKCSIFGWNQIDLLEIQFAENCHSTMRIVKNLKRGHGSSKPQSKSVLCLENIFLFVFGNLESVLHLNTPTQCYTNVASE